MTLNANILFSLVANETDAVDFAKDVRTTKVESFIELTDGTGANQAQVVWGDKRSFGEGGSDVLAMRSLSDDRGTVTFSAIKVLYLKNTHGQNQIDWRSGSAFADYWQEFGFAEEGASETIIPAGCSIVLFSPTAGGWGVSAGSDSLHLFASEGTTYEIVLIGEGTIT